MKIKNTSILLITALLTISTTLQSCCPKVTKLYDGESRKSTETALLRSGPKLIINRIDDMKINDDFSERNDYTDRTCAHGKWYELLPGEYTVEVEYAGFFTHFNPEYAYIYLIFDSICGPYLTPDGSEVYLDMKSSDVQLLTIILEAGKKYEIRSELVNNSLRPFKRPQTPELIAPRNRTLFVVQNLANPEKFLSVLREDQLMISNFAWKAYTVELDSEDDFEDKKPENSPLAKALESRQSGFAEFLIAAGADIDQKTSLGITSLHRTAIAGEYKSADLLLRMGAKENAASESGMTPLHLAAENGHFEIVDLLIKHGAEVDARNKMNATPLFYAAGNGHTEVAGFLIKSGANVNICQKNKWTPLHHAVHGGHIEVARLLLHHGATVNPKTDIDLTPLMIAVNEEHADIVALLFEYGAETKYGDENGWTALHYAAKTGDTSIIRLLVEAGAMIDAVSETNCTPLHSASMAGNYDAVEMLLEYGANVNAVSRGGFTPLHMAAVDGNAKLGQLLINYGADTSAKLNNGQTPYDIAIEKSQVLFIGLLRNAE